MMISDLPVDLFEEILSRVPATSLKRLRSTCKRWNALFTNQEFTEKHLRKAPKQPLILMLKEHRLISMSVNLNVVPPSIKFQDALDLKVPHSNNSKHVDIVRVIHSDGLLLCITKENIPVVWNPFLGETRWIHHKNGYGGRNFALGYENNRSCRSYKILMFYETDGDRVDDYDIYEFNSNSWRVFNTPNRFRIESDGLTLKGNIYWLSFDNLDIYLLSFDFTRERFRRFCLPLTFQNCAHISLSVVREEKLSVLRCIGLSKMEMWVTNKIDSSEAELSWSKSFAVNYGILVNSSLLIDEDKKVTLCCGIDSNNYIVEIKVCTIGEEDKYYKEIPLPRYSQRYHMFIYVPSLVQIQQDIESDEVTTPSTVFVEKLMQDIESDEVTTPNTVFVEKQMQDIESDEVTTPNIVFVEKLMQALHHYISSLD